VIEVVSRPKRILGSSPQIQSLQKLVQQAALTDSPILIYGERGSGREFVAEILHETSHRRTEPFEKMNCAGWTETFLETEIKRRLDRAERGTLFLDDINELPPHLLALALSGRPRVIAACDAGQELGGFRNEFGIRITLPPLRQRKLDIPILADHFIERFAADFGKSIRGAHPLALRKLMAYQWPGNIRELKNAVERAVMLATGHILAVTDFSFLAIEDEDRPLQFKIPGATIHEIEKEAILRTLEYVGGSTTAAAKMLNMSVRKIQYKLKEYRKLPEPQKAQKVQNA
jgi:DNA-binding NtrC family response regulator